MLSRLCFLISSLLLFFVFSLDAQQQIATSLITSEVVARPATVKRFAIGGVIKDAKTGEMITGVSISVLELPKTGSFSNEHGFYSLSLPAGTYTLVFNYLGYQTLEKNYVLTKDRSENINLRAGEISLDEIVVTGQRKDANVTNVQTSVEKLSIQDLNKLPVLMGERDILKSIQLVPGVKAAGEGNTGFYVRGGGADQNLILLDNALVYNPSHLFGFFSTFNSDAIKDVTVYKGVMPAQYGERLSSTLDISMKEGNNQQYDVSGGIGLISSKLNIEGPIQKEKSSFLISGRRTYADMLARASGMEEAQNTTLYFYDVNAKMNYILSDKDRLFISAYFGRDKLGADNLADIGWGNKTVTARWNHIVNSKMFSNTSLVYNDFDFDVDININTNFKITSTIQDWGVKQEFQFFPNPTNSLRFGFNSTYHRVLPGELSTSDTENLRLPTIAHRFSSENGIYVSNNWKATDRLSVMYGVRLSSFTVLGGSPFYDYVNQTPVDTTYYAKGKIVKNYLHLEPRISSVYQLTSTSSIKMAYGRTTQNMHLLSNNSMSSPTDRWTPTSNYIKPEIADQVSLGYFKNFKDNLYEFSVEGYYKNLQNQIDYKDGAETQQIENIETELLFGKGRTYGVEFFFKKKYGRFNGWIGYTLSRSEKKIDGINKNQWYDAKQDRRHDISVVGIYQLSKKWSLSATWVYYTGEAITFPSAKYQVDGTTVLYFAERNGYRTPAYHRLDFGATRTLKKRKNFESELAIGLYNVYGRENPYMIGFRDKKEDHTQTEVYQISLFKYVPSISWNFKF